MNLQNVVTRLMNELSILPLSTGTDQDGQGCDSSSPDQFPEQMKYQKSDNREGYGAGHKARYALNGRRQSFRPEKAVQDYYVRSVKDHKNSQSESRECQYFFGKQDSPAVSSRAEKKHYAGSLLL